MRIGFWTLLAGAAYAGIEHRPDLEPWTTWVPLGFFVGAYFYWSVLVALSLMNGKVDWCKLASPAEGEDTQTLAKSKASAKTAMIHGLIVQTLAAGSLAVGAGYTLTKQREGTDIKLRIEALEQHLLEERGEGDEQQ